MQIWEAASFTHLLLFSIKRVGPDPWVWDGESWRQVEGWQEGGERPFQEVRVPTHRVLRLAHVRALGKEANVAGWEEKREENWGKELRSAGDCKVAWTDLFPIA